MNQIINCDSCGKKVSRSDIPEEKWISKNKSFCHCDHILHWQNPKKGKKEQRNEK